ncbi:MAG: hypothetical protein EBV49_05355 [Betaproteobacteria bacterium]|nr:hypothetical protein [Betaproteobacteria bacterium]
MQKRGFKRLCKPRTHFSADFEPVDHNIDGVTLMACKHWRLIEIVNRCLRLLAAHPNPNKALGTQVLKERLVFAFTLDHLGCHHKHALPVVMSKQTIDHLRHGLGFEDLIRVKRTVRRAGSCKKQTQVIMNLGHRAHRGPGIVA